MKEEIWISIKQNEEKMKEMKNDLNNNDKIKIIEYDNGDRYEGQVKNGKREGKGTLYTNYGRYDCNWVNDLMYYNY